MLNRFLCRYPFLLPSIQEIMHTVDGLTFVSILGLNMGFWTILLDKGSHNARTMDTYQQKFNAILNCGMSPYRLDWPMDNSATPFQKSQALCETRCEATASSPCVNYDQSEY
jgi:hypothetical protein